MPDGKLVESLDVLQNTHIPTSLMKEETKLQHYSFALMRLAEQFHFFFQTSFFFNFFQRFASRIHMPVSELMVGGVSPLFWEITSFVRNKRFLGGGPKAELVELAEHEKM